MDEFFSFLVGLACGCLLCFFAIASSDDIVTVKKAGDELVVSHKDRLYKLVEVKP